MKKDFIEVSLSATTSACDEKGINSNFVFQNTFANIIEDRLLIGIQI